MEDRINYWLNEFSTPVGKVELSKDEQIELHKILKKLYEDNKMIYGQSEEYIKLD